MYKHEVTERSEERECQWCEKKTKHNVRETYQKWDYVETTTAYYTCTECGERTKEEESH